MAMTAFGCAKQDDTKEAHLSRANDYFAAGQYDKAETEYRDVLRLAADDPAAVRQLALIYQSQGQFPRAYPLLKKSADSNPDDLELQIKLGFTLQALRRYKEAREAAMRILDKQPGHEQALVLLANTAFGLNDVDATRKLIEGLRDKDQNRAGYHLALGLLDMAQTNQTRAESEFKVALDLDPKSAGALTELGAIYWNRNELTEADQAFKAAADLSPPRSPMGLRYAAFKFRTGNIKEAKQILEDIALKTPDYLPMQVALMKLACTEPTNAEQTKDCTERVRKILIRDEGNFDALFQDGLLNLAQGDATKAIREFEYLNNNYSQIAQLRYQLARAYLLFAKNASLVNSRNALNSAELNLSETIKLDPKFAPASLLLAELKIRKGSPAAAVDLLIPLSKVRPAIDQAHYLLASAYLAQQQPDQALAIYRQMSELLPQDPQPPFLIGRMLLGQRQSIEARKEFEKSVEISSDYLPASEMLVNFDLADKRYAAATDRVQQLIDKNPKLAQPWAIRGKIYLAQRDFTHAEPDLLKAIELDSTFEPAYLLLAQLYVASSRQDQAIAKLNAFVENSKTDKTKTASALLQLATIHQGLEHFEAARDAYEKLLAVAPGFVPALNNLALLYSEKLGQLDKAYDLAKKAKELAPNDPHIADTAGWITFKKGDFVEAQRLLQDSANKLPESPEIEFHLGMANYMLGQEAPARVALQKAADAHADFVGKDDARRRLAILSLDSGALNTASQRLLDDYLRERPSDPVGLFRRAQLQERQGPPDQATKTYETIVESNPQFAPALRRLAIVYARSNQLAKASAVAQKALQAYPDDPQVADALGWIQFKNKEYDKALPLLRNSAAKLPDEPEAQFHLGMAYYMLGEEGPARVALQKAMNGDFPEKDDARRRLELLAVHDGTTATPSVTLPQLENFLRDNPNDPFALFRLARLQQQQGTLNEPVSAYERILVNNPNFSPAIRQLAILYAHDATADLNKAFEIGTRARAAFPEDPEITKTLGILNYRRAYYPQAAEQLKSAASSRKDDSELLYYLGQTYHELKRHKDCQQAMDNALNLNLPPELIDTAKRVLADCAEKSSAQ